MLAGKNALDGGFVRPVLDAQATFRTLMDAMARPASILDLEALTAPPSSLGATAGAIACTLVDADTTVWLDDTFGKNDTLSSWLAFHTGARLVPACAEAAFALIGSCRSMPPLDRFAQGSQEYPDRSATLILQLEALDGGGPLAFEGPGIKGRATIAPIGLPEDFARQWTENRARFPRGVDLILAGGDAVACLPRSARLVGWEG